MGGFGDYYGVTSVHPLGAIAVVLLGVLTLALPRRQALVPFIIAACTIPMAQRFVIAGGDFTLLRLLILFGAARVLSRNEMRGVIWTGMDTLVMLWCVSCTLIMTLQHGPDILVNRAGWSYDILGTYFLVRCFIRDWDDVLAFARGTSWTAVPVMGFFALEWVTRYNAFSIFGGVREITWIREGRMRCQGAFSHPILAGTFWAATLPLIWMLWHEGVRARQLCIMGTVGALGVIMACSSSTPLMSVAAVAGSVALYRFRDSRRFMWIGLFVVLSLLHLVMNQPVWHLLARANIISGSTGWHRFKIFDAFVNNFDRWWALGEPDPMSWGVWEMRDITNQYMIEGLRGGLLTLVVFVALLAVAFRYIGRMLHTARARRAGFAVEKRIWLLGAALFMHVVTFFAVSYFGQMITIFYIQLGLISAMYQHMALSRARSRPQARTAWTGVQSADIPL